MRRPWLRGSIAIGTALGVVLGALLAAASWGPTGDLRSAGPSFDPVGPTTPQGSAPQVIIDAPAPGANFTGGVPATISFHVTDFNLTQDVGQGNIAGEGHVAVYVDGGFLEALYNVSPLDLPLQPGYHHVELELVNNDGTALSPPVESGVTFGMTDGPSTATPSIRLWGPVNGATIEGPTVTITWTVYNFAIVQPDGQPNAPNEGHVHAFVDGFFFAMITVEEPFQITGLPSGAHQIELVLVNNDHSYYLNDSRWIDVTTNITVVNPAVFNATAVEDVEGIAISGLVVSLVVLAVVLFKGRRARSPPAVPPAPKAPAPSSPPTKVPPEAREPLDEYEAE